MLIQPPVSTALPLSMRSTLVCLALLLSLPAGCRKAEPAGFTAKRQKAAQTKAKAASGGAKQAAATAPKMRRGGKRQVGVYLDGKPIAALRYGEMPKSVPTVWVEHGIPESDGSRPEQRSFRLADYLEGLGLKIGALRTILLAAGRTSRISHIDPKALLKHRKAMFLAFTGGTRGGVEMRYAPDIPSNDVIDKLLNVYLYRDKPAPKWNAKARRYEFAGQAMRGIPHLEERVGRGSRIYLDDRLIGIYTRRQGQARPRQAGGGQGDGRGAGKHGRGDGQGGGSQGRVGQGGGGGAGGGQGRGGQAQASQPFSLAAYVQSLSPKAKTVQLAEVVSEERVVATFDAPGFSKVRAQALPHSGGQLQVLPDKHPVQALRLYTRRIATPSAQKFSVPEP
ncbi:MAG: hypothetical protein ACPGUV_02570 [Polyangiales bacterium]